MRSTEKDILKCNMHPSIDRQQNELYGEIRIERHIDSDSTNIYEAPLV